MDFLKKLGLNIKDNLQTKTYGFYVGLASLTIMILLAFIYGGIEKTLFNSDVMLCAILGICLFVVFSIFKETALLSQVSIVVFSFLSFCAFANTDGMIDYVSTQFFDGFSMAKLFALDYHFWLSIILILLAFIVSSVALYMPQNKTKEIK